MEMETKRLNPLSSKDWQYCSDSVPNTGVWKVAVCVLSAPMAILIFVAFTDILNAIPDGAGKGLGAPLFGVSLIVGTFMVSFLITNLYMSFTAALFFMVRGKRAPDEDEPHAEYPGQPVTAALAEALQPQENAGVYEVDCSLTLACSECGKELCPGCGSECQLNFSEGEAVAWCVACTGAVVIPA